MPKPFAPHGRPTGPMIRLLRRVAKGEAIPVTPTAPARPGLAHALAGLVARGLVTTNAGDDEVTMYRLTDAGRAELHAARTLSPA